MIVALEIQDETKLQHAYHETIYNYVSFVFYIFQANL